MDNKKLIGIDSLEEGLKKYLSPDMVSSILQSVQVTNDEVVNQDLLRRSAPPAAPVATPHQSSLLEQGVIQQEIGLEVIEKLTETFIGSDVMQSVLNRLTLIEEAHEKQTLKYENQILRLNQELADLKKSDDDKYTARLNNVPATRKVVLTLANNGGVSRGYAPQQQEITNDQLEFNQRIEASKARTHAFMAKNNRGGK